MQRFTLIGCSLAVLMLGTGVDWRQFRGNDSNGLASTEAPTDWNDGAPIAWSVELEGRGLASPIVVDGQVIVTCSSGAAQQRLHVLSFDEATGEKQWERQFWATGRTTTHPTSCVAAPTPASDGQRIFAFFSSNDVACLDLDGNLLWYRGLTYDYPNATNSLGMASSPLVVGDTLIVMVESDADSFTAALNVETGETRWRKERPRASNWTSPVSLADESAGKSWVLLQSSAGVSAVDPQTGEEAWSYADGAATMSSSVVVGDTAYVPSHGVTAIRAGRSNPQVPEIVWNEGGLQPGTSSLTAADGRLYVVNNGGVLTCANLEDGKRIWQLRLEGKFKGSPVIAGGHLFIFNEEGVGFCVNLGNEKGRIVGNHEFGESFLSTPAVSDGAMYVRTDGHLWKLAQP